MISREVFGDNEEIFSGEDMRTDCGVLAGVMRTDAEAEVNLGVAGVTVLEVNEERKSAG